MNSTEACRILGIELGASDATIKSAYRRLAAEWHPDRNPSADATKRMQQINQAYQYLSNNGSSGPDADSSGPGSGGWPFGAGGARSNGGASRESPGRSKPEEEWVPDADEHKVPRDIHRTVTLTLEELAIGCQRVLSGSIVDLCPACRGAKVFMNLMADCEDCFGEGVNYAGYSYRRTKCRSCNGTGCLFRKCHVCKGSGAAVNARQWTVTVNIPKGARPGAALRVPGKGQRAHGHDAGNLEIRVEAKPHPLFHVDEEGHLAATVPVDLFTFMSKGVVDVPSLGGGASIRFDLSKGTLQSLDGAGLPDRDGALGPLVLRAVPVPPQELSERERLYLFSLAKDLREEGYARCPPVAEWMAASVKYQSSSAAPPLKKGRRGKART